MLKKYSFKSLIFLKNLFAKDRNPSEIRTFGDIVATLATIIATITFFIDFARNPPESIPLWGIFLTIASLASFILEGAIFVERVNNGQKVGTWVGMLTFTALAAGMLGAFLLLAGLS